MARIFNQYARKFFFIVFGITLFFLIIFIGALIAVVAPEAAIVFAALTFLYLLTSIIRNNLPFGFTSRAAVGFLAVSAGITLALSALTLEDSKLSILKTKDPEQYARLSAERQLAEERRAAERRLENERRAEQEANEAARKEQSAREQAEKKSRRMAG